MMTFLEQWRVAMDITNFYLIGHSYGGFVAGNYASFYPQHVRKLILLSPLGCKPRPEKNHLKYLRFKGGRGPPKWAAALGTKTWGMFTPFAVGRKLSPKKVRKSILRYVTRHQPCGSEEERDNLVEYLY